MKEDLNYVSAGPVPTAIGVDVSNNRGDEDMKLSARKTKFREYPRGEVIGGDYGTKTFSSEPVDEKMPEQLKEILEDTDGEGMEEAQDVYDGPTEHVQSEYAGETARGDGPLIARSTPYNISIKPLDYGYEVSVGCQTFAVEKPSTLGNFITEYLTNPKKTTKHWYANEARDRLAAYRD